MSRTCCRFKAATPHPTLQAPNKITLRGGTSLTISPMSDEVRHALAIRIQTLIMTILIIIHHPFSATVTVDAYDTGNPSTDSEPAAPGSTVNNQ